MEINKSSSPDQDTSNNHNRSQKVEDKAIPFIMAFNPQPVTNPELYYSVYDGQSWGITQRVQHQGQSIKAVGDPVVIEWNNLIHLFYTGLNKYMYKSTFDGLNWSLPSQVLPSLKAAGHPAVTVLNNRLYVAYRRDGGNHVDFATNVGTQQERSNRIPGIGSSGPPDLTTFNGRVLMAWKGIPGDNGIYWMFPEVPGASQTRISGVGTDLGVSLTSTPVGDVVMGWIGVNDDKRMWCSSYTDSLGWSPQMLAVPQDAWGVPVVSVYNGKVIMAWVNQPSGYYVFLGDEKRFSPTDPIAGFNNHRNTGQFGYWSPALSRRY
jgi:hypothetical protein